MKYLPPAAAVPECFKVLGFERVPESSDEINARYKRLAPAAHPDTGGSAEQFRILTEARERALAYIANERDGDMHG